MPERNGRSCGKAGQGEVDDDDLSYADPPSAWNLRRVTGSAGVCEARGKEYLPVDVGCQTEIRERFADDTITGKRCLVRERGIWAH
jgi:hypothetical protein